MPRLFAILRLSVFLFSIYVFLSFRLFIFLSAFLISFGVTYANLTLSDAPGDIVNTDQLEIFHPIIISPEKTKVLIDAEGQYSIRKYPLQMRHETIVEAVDPFTSEPWANDHVTGTASVSTTKRASLSHPVDPSLIAPFSNASPGTVNLRQGIVATWTLNSIQFSDLGSLNVDICIR
ncbi:hypothetical protein F5887DRAFT_978639 [Amanita rubescens]|nr:hypothetical protein F5887DRAFT_978639 [Amanita rubescens]